MVVRKARQLLFRVECTRKYSLTQSKPYLELPTRGVGARERLEADPSDAVLVMRLFLLPFLLEPLVLVVSG